MILCESGARVEVGLVSLVEMVFMKCARKCSANAKLDLRLN